MNDYLKLSVLDFKLRFWWFNCTRHAENGLCGLFATFSLFVSRQQQKPRSTNGMKKDFPRMEHGEERVARRSPGLPGLLPAKGWRG